MKYFLKGNNLLFSGVPYLDTEIAVTDSVGMSAGLGQKSDHDRRTKKKLVYYSF